MEYTISNTGNLVIVFIILVILYAFYKTKSYETFKTDSEGNPTEPNIHAIKMFDSSPGYEKPYIKINVGDVVVWTNIGEQQHSVTSKDLKFDSGYLVPGQSVAFQFTKPGTYEYYSIPQLGWMLGVIEVV